MNEDVVKVYSKLSSKYPVALNSSLDLGYKSKIDFPVLSGTSSAGKFEVFFDGVSFPFYAMHDNGEMYAHWHLQTLEELEEAVVNFMNRNNTQI